MRIYPSMYTRPKPCENLVKTVEKSCPTQKYGRRNKEQTPLTKTEFTLEDLVQDWDKALSDILQELEQTK